MGFLQRFYAECDVLIPTGFTGEVERAVARKRLLDEQQRFVGERAAVLKVSALGTEEVRHDARNQAELEAAVGDVV